MGRNFWATCFGKFSSCASILSGSGFEMWAGILPLIWTVGVLICEGHTVSTVR
jgi:hypothetical protein